MGKILTTISWLFVFFVPFYDVPRTFRTGIAISGIIGVFFIFLSFLNNICSTKHKLKTKYPVLLFIPFIIFIFFYIFSLFLNSSVATSKSFNHILLYIYSFIVYTLVPFVIIRNQGTIWFSKVLSYSSILISLIGFYEVSLFFTSGWEAYANFLNHGQMVGIFAGLPRLRSTFNEPSHFALYSICTFPILLYSKNYFSLGLTTLAFLFTFSASALTGVIGALAIFLALNFYNLVNQVKTLKVRSFFLLIIFSLLLVYLMEQTETKWYYELYFKITNVEASDPTRYEGWQKTISLVFNSFFFGYGPASYYHYLGEYGVFNWYLQILLESGIFGLSSIIIMLLTAGIVVHKTKIPLGKFFLCAFSIQMVAMSHYFIPGFWILIAFIFSRNSELKQKRKTYLIVSKKLLFLHE